MLQHYDADDAGRCVPAECDIDRRDRWKPRYQPLSSVVRREKRPHIGPKGHRRSANSVQRRTRRAPRGVIDITDRFGT
ncbi:hypothetical protein C8039_05730 [Halogeometricum sp. wsp3]|nr:hypothetical protein C8039_05730 [Halogeometricum sp. wsp3]